MGTLLPPTTVHWRDAPDEPHVRGADRSYTTTRRCRATPRACAPRPRAPPRTPPAHPTMRPGRCLSEDSQSNPHLRKRVFASESLAGTRRRCSCKRYTFRKKKKMELNQKISSSSSSFNKYMKL